MVVESILSMKMNLMIKIIWKRMGLKGNHNRHFQVIEPKSHNLVTHLPGVKGLAKNLKTIIDSW